MAIRPLGHGTLSWPPQLPLQQTAGMWQGEVKLAYRLGGKSKRPEPVTQWRDRVIEQVIERPIIIKGEPEVLHHLLDGVFFDFNSSEISETSVEALDRIAALLLRQQGKHFLITGYTDAIGSAQYNNSLSLARAEAVKKALIARGMPSDYLKIRGVGKRIAIAPVSAFEATRSQDRKITIEVILDSQYWEGLR